MCWREEARWGQASRWKITFRTQGRSLLEINQQRRHLQIPPAGTGNQIVGSVDFRLVFTQPYPFYHQFNFDFISATRWRHWEAALTWWRWGLTKSSHCPNWPFWRPTLFLQSFIHLMKLKKKESQVHYSSRFALLMCSQHTSTAWARRTAQRQALTRRWPAHSPFKISFEFILRLHIC